MILKMMMMTDGGVGGCRDDGDDNDDELQLLAISARTGNHHCNRSYQYIS